MATATGAGRHAMRVRIDVPGPGIFATARLDICPVAGTLPASRLRGPLPLRQPPNYNYSVLPNSPCHEGCEATQGAVYRTDFQVQPDGQVSDATSATGDGCVQEALRSGVTTFSYIPVGEMMAVAFDWMNVTASRRN